VTNTPSTNVEVPALRQLVDGEWSEATVDLGVALENPNTGEEIARQTATTDADVERVAAAADRVHRSGAWSGRSPEERADVLESVADALDKVAPQIAELESLGSGVNIKTTGMLAGVIIGGSFRLAAAQIRGGLLEETYEGPTGKPVEVHHLPWGPALSLVPWNSPAPMAAHKIANSLAAGAPTILKPSEWAPYGTTLVAETVGAALTAAGVPDGVFQYVQGGSHVGGALVSDARIRSISFTGGLGGGRAIASVCAYDFKPAQLELGGNNPIVVLDDADVDAASTGIVDLMTTLNGQWCRALGRLILDEKIADAVLEAVYAKLANVKIGDSLDPASDMGPIVHSGHLALLRSTIAGAQLKSTGVSVHAPTPLPDRPGNWLAPTLIDGLSDAERQDEIFGPVASIHRGKNDAELLALANGTPFGLEGYVFTGDEERGLRLARQVHAGGVKVNGSTILSLNLMAPRPAWGLSGQVAEGTTETLLFFTNPRVVGVENLSAGDLAKMANSR
jgi:acyl-CoA reductase-like NAD-dependent aldehyde dehydrogenase